MRASTAYFVGGGTMIAAIAIGLGGGIVAGNIMNPIAPKHGADSARMERRAEPVAAVSAPAEGLQYLTGSQAFGAVVAAPAQAEAPTAPAKSEAQSTQTAVAAEPKTSTESKTATEPKAVPRSVEAKSVESRSVESKSAESKTSDKPADPKAASHAKPVEQEASADPSASVDNAYAKARDSDLKRAASERRRTERRQRWAERRHYESRDRTDWDDVARNVREDSEARDYGSRDYGYRPRQSFPQIRLFGDD